MKRRLIFLAVLLLGLTVDLGAQTFSAQIQQFWNQLRTGALVFTNLVATGGTITGVTVTSPKFTGQWTVNGSLCAAGQVVQGGSPTTCTASPVASLFNASAGGQVRPADLRFNNSTLTFQNPSFPVGDFGRAFNFDDTKGGILWRAIAQDNSAGPSYDLDSWSNDLTNTHIPTTLFREIPKTGGGDRTNTKLVSFCYFNFVNTLCDDLGSGLVTGMAHAPSNSDGFLDMFGYGVIVQRTLAFSGGSLANTETAGRVLQNPIAATNGVQVQLGPSSDICGSAWNAASEYDCWRVTNRPAAGSPTTSTWALRSSINNGAFADRFTVTNAGLGTLATMNATTAYQLNGTPGVGFALNKAQPADQTARSSSGAFVMMGLGAAAEPCTVTPTSTGRVVFTISGDIVNNTTATTVTIQMAESTGTAPANNGAASGTVISGAPVLDGLTSALTVPFSITSSVTGLALSTAVWFDLQLRTSTTNTGQPTNITCVAHEI